MKKDRQTRELAEEYIFGDKKNLTAEQIQQIKKSPFKEVIKEQDDSYFLNLVEKELEKIDLAKKETDSTKPFSIKKQSYFSGVNRGEVRQLIHAIEDHFDLGIIPDYEHIKIEELKDFIKKFAEHSVEDSLTKHDVLEICDKQDTAAHVMGALKTIAL